MTQIERPNYTAGFEVDGPFPEPIAVPCWVAVVVFALLCFAAGAVVSALS